MFFFNFIIKWFNERKWIFSLLLILIIASFLRFYDIGTESYWYDEIASIRESDLNIEGIAQSANHPPLYFLLLNLWIKLFGENETTLRALSAIFGIVSILLIYKIGNILFNKRVGLIASLLAALSTFYIYHSQEVRSYSLLLLLSLISYYFFIVITRQDKKWHYPCYLIANLLLGYTHLYGLLIIASQVLFFLLFWVEYRPITIKLSSTIAVTIFGLTPLIFLLFNPAATLAAEGFWITQPGLDSIFGTLAAFSGGDIGSLYSRPSAGKYFMVPLFVILIIIGLFSIKLINGKWHWKSPGASLRELSWQIDIRFAKEELLLLLWLLISIFIPFVESRIWTPIYHTKYMIGASPAFLLLVAKGMGNLNKKWIIYPILAFIIVLSSFGLQSYYKGVLKEQWREAASFVEDNAEGNDILVFCGGTHIELCFDYYYQCPLPRYRIGKDEGDPEYIANFINTSSIGKDRLWVILSRCTTNTKCLIKSFLLNIYGNQAVVLEKEFVLISVLLLDLSYH